MGQARRAKHEGGRDTENICLGFIGRGIFSKPEISHDRVELI